MSCKIFLQSLAIEMDPRSKQDAVRSEPLNIEDIYADETAKTADEDASQVPLEDCVREVGGIVLRGNRIVLVRSLKKEFAGVRIPAEAPREDESDEACAVRAVSRYCEIDGDEEVRVLPFVPRGVVYRPNSRPVVLTLVALEAVHPPPDGPLEDADIEDEDDCKHQSIFM